MMVDETDFGFMRLALLQAEAAVAKGQTPFGAVMVDRGGAVVGAGHNTVRADRDPAAHGEMVAMRDAWQRLGDRAGLAECTLYTSCEPCLLCSYAITQFRVRRVVFAARATDVPGVRPLLGASLSEAAEWVNRQQGWTPLEVQGEVMRDEAVAILQTFDWSAV